MRQVTGSAPEEGTAPAIRQLRRLILHLDDRIALDSLPDPERWEGAFDRLVLTRHDGFHHGSPITRGNVGLHAIFEGQARFIQLQFLAASGGPSTCADDGYLSGIYAEAFTEFMRLSEFDWPETIDSPSISSF